MRWEYKIIDSAQGINPDSEDGLNYMGSTGWELTAIRRSDNPFGGYRYYFKRQTDSERSED